MKKNPDSHIPPEHRPPSPNERPKCVYCGKPLGLVTDILLQPGRPKPGDRIDGSFLVRGVVRKSTGYYGTQWLVWDGTYKGYGCSEITGLPFFCRLECSLLYANRKANVAEASVKKKRT